MKTLWITGVFLAVAAASTLPADALTLIQTVGPQNFSTSGDVANTTPLVFPPFSAGHDETLLGVRVKIVPSSFSGTYDLLRGSNNTVTNYTSVTVGAIPKFTFTGTIGSSAGTSQTLLASPTTLTCPNFLSFCGMTANLVPTSQSYTGMFSQLAATPTTVPYWMGTPTISASQVAYTKVQVPLSPALALEPSNLAFSGQVYLEYEYVPGPLPILGAGAAFGWSRRLRKRIAKNT